MGALRLALAVLLAVGPASATEADHYTLRRLAPDCALYFDGAVNQRLEETASKLNDWVKARYGGLAEACGLARDIRAGVKERVSGLNGHLTEKILRDCPGALATRPDHHEFGHVPGRAATKFARTNIYRGTANVRHDQAVIVRYGDVVFSEDKGGHFFSHGFELFYHFDLKLRPMSTEERGILDRFLNPSIKVPDARGDEGAVELCHIQEDGVFGLENSGVKSYADMVANYEGMKFWAALTDGDRPYFKCDPETGWSVARGFSLAEYITPAWDESINCNEYTAHDAPIVDGNIKEWQAANGLKARGCPSDGAACGALRARYSGVLSRLLHPSCR